MASLRTADIEIPSSLLLLEQQQLSLFTVRLRPTILHRELQQEQNEGRSSEGRAGAQRDHSME